MAVQVSDFLCSCVTVDREMLRKIPEEADWKD